MSNRSRTTTRKPARASRRRRRGTSRLSRAAQQQARRQKTVTVAIVGAIAVVAIMGVAVAANRDAATAPEGGADVPETGRRHVTGTVDYAHNPPAGGDHASVWQNCGFYDQPVANESAVHSLEHGAVWIQYRTDLPAAARDEIKRLTDRDPYVLASPFDNLDSPVVLSAWGNQLALEDVTDPRIDAFLEAFVQGPQTPEPGATCRGEIGEPAT
jgi:hypothetical protein